MLKERDQLQQKLMRMEQEAGIRAGSPPEIGMPTGAERMSDLSRRLKESRGKYGVTQPDLRQGPPGQQPQQVPREVSPQQQLAQREKERGDRYLHEIPY